MLSVHCLSFPYDCHLNVSEVSVKDHLIRQYIAKCIDKFALNFPLSSTVSQPFSIKYIPMIVGKISDTLSDTFYAYLTNYHINLICSIYYVDTTFTKQSIDT